MNNKENDINQELEQMRQDYAALKDCYDKQQIINDQLLRKAMKQTTGRLRFNSNLTIVAGVLAVLLAFLIPQLGLSKPFFFFTLGLIVVAVIVSILAARHLPNLDGDLVTAAAETVRFKKIYATWTRIAIPIFVVWFGLFVWVSLRGRVVPASNMIAFVVLLVVFCALTIYFGMKHRRGLQDATDELLSQIEQLRKGGN